MAMKLIVGACLCLGVTRLHGQPNPAADQKFWMPDGPVSTILVTNGTVYLGGDFSYVGPRTGPSALFDQNSGQLLTGPARINGTVKTVLPDGNGGWFVGGTFSSIGGVTVTNLAHLNRDLSLDKNWNAQITGTAINALLLDSGRLYVGGQYTKIRGQSISGLAAVNPSDATLVAAWNPQLGGSVNAMRLASGLLYIGGNFFNVGNSNIANLAAISTTTALATGWRTDPDSQVFALEVSGNTVYVGGQFTQIGFGANLKPRNRLASLDATTGVVNTWNPNPNGIVRALALAGTTVYLGGDFTTAGGSNRRGFAAVNSGNGAAQTLDLLLQSVGTVNLVRAILLQGNSLYVGGSFSNALGALHFMVVGLDVTTSQPLPIPLATDFNGSAGSVFGVNTLASANEAMLVGGDFQSFGGVARQRAAALSLTTGAALPWAPSFDAPVFALAYGTNRIYVGGSFTNYNTTNANPTLGRGLAAVDPVTGNPVAFNFFGTNQSGNTSISSLIVASNMLYAGGNFSIVATEQRRFLVALDPATGGVITNFNAKLGGGFSGVTNMVRVRTNLYIAGDFTTVNAVSVPRLAAVATTDGTARTWTPSPNQVVNILAVAGDNLYVGGNFSQIGGIAFRNFAAYSTLDNSLLGVDASLPNFAQGVFAIGATPTTLYVGGSFDSIGGEFRGNLGCLASFNASAYAWDPFLDQPPAVITLTDEMAFVGGPFRFTGRNSSPTNQVNAFLAVFPRGPQILNISLTPTNTVKILTTTGDRTDAVIQAVNDPNDTNWINVATNDVPGFSWTAEFPTATPPQRLFRAAAR